MLCGGLTPGSYRGTIRIAAPNASPAGVTVTANLTVRPAVPAKLGVKADALAFSFFQGSGDRRRELSNPDRHSRAPKSDVK